MSKPIINGIDVSECPLYDKNTGCYHTFNGECVKDSCAVYKWLLEYKRLQEENKKLKLKIKNNETVYQTELATYNMECGNLLEENKDLIQALEKIRHFIQVYVPEKEADYNSAKKTHPVFFGLLEQIKYHCNEVLEDDENDTTINK